MNHAELSRDLALAIGYYPESVVITPEVPGLFKSVCRVYRWWPYAQNTWTPFDYTNPTVWGPVLEWLMHREVRPEFYVAPPHFGMLRAGEFGSYPPIDIEADTLPEAVARAAIAVGAK